MMERRGNLAVVGVYCIKNMRGTIKYVGASPECNDAYSRHNHNLIKGEYAYTNKHAIQELFNEEDLIFTILEECREEELDDLETKYIEIYKDTIVNRDKKGKRRKSKPTVEETERRRNANLGSNNPNCRLSVEDVKEIKRMLNEGVKQSKIAEEYGVSGTLVWNIAHGKRWGSVDI